MSRRFLPTLIAVAGSAVTIAALATPVSASQSVLDSSTSPDTLATAQRSLSAQLGGSFGNSWLNDAGKLVIGVTDVNRIGEIRAAGAEAKVVEHSAASLNSIKSILDSRARTAPDSVTGWAVDVRTNKVVVSVLKSDPAGLAWAKATGGGALQVERVT
ncbi:MAG: S1 family peptidase, partial [Actinomycetota bacterium]|nr:S1 family peptidase [Actinomycetota bacterium]